MYLRPAGMHVYFPEYLKYLANLACTYFFPI